MCRCTAHSLLKLPQALDEPLLQGPQVGRSQPPMQGEATFQHMHLQVRNTNRASHLAEKYGDRVIPYI